MPAVVRTPRQNWVGMALKVLAEGGPEAVRVEVLAAKLGVSKGGFYGYFTNRDALLEEMLDEWERRSTEDVVDQAESERRDTRERMRLAGELTFSEELLPVDLAIRSWARNDEEVADRLRRVDNFRMDYLRTMFGTFIEDPDEIEARSLLAFATAIGQHFIAADHGRHSKEEAVELAATFLLNTAKTTP